MNQKERETALISMQALSSCFYYHATRIGVHPFLEFNGLLVEYIKICQEAHDNGIDFTECSKHSGRHLPMDGHQINYINEKLECIFEGQSVMVDGDQRSHILRLRLALTPFVRLFEKRYVNRSKSQRKWFLTLPDDDFIDVRLTMGECRAAVKALEESLAMDEAKL